MPVWLLSWHTTARLSLLPPHIDSTALSRISCYAISIWYLKLIQRINSCWLNYTKKSSTNRFWNKPLCSSEGSELAGAGESEKIARERKSDFICCTMFENSKTRAPTAGERGWRAREWRNWNVNVCWFDKKHEKHVFNILCILCSVRRVLESAGWVLEWFLTLGVQIKFCLRFQNDGLVGT